MSDAKPQPEPSMEEIIASISRIIAEDKPPGDRLRTAESARDDVFDLTEALNDDGSVRHLKPPNIVVSESPKDPPAPRIEPEPPRIEPTVAPKPPSDREPILSAATAGAAAAAFARLGEVPREPRVEDDLPLGDPSRTLEDIARDALRPLLQAWLDKNLPGIVERLVREEIGRVVRGAGLR
jgi:hypothetical protein